MADPDHLADRVAALLLLERLLRPERPVGLATGRTMEPVYRALARQLQQLASGERERVRRQWLSFNLDEYGGLGPEDPASFAAGMAEQVVKPLGLASEQVHLPDGRAADPGAEAHRYGEAVAAAGGIGLQLLGLGLNGHVGFNEPPCGPDARCRSVRLSATTRRANAASFSAITPTTPPRGSDRAPDPDPPGRPGWTRAVPEWAITLGLAEILAADRIILAVSGSAKADVLRRALQEPPTAQLPASWLQRHPRVTVIADFAALGGHSETSTPSPVSTTRTA